MRRATSFLLPLAALLWLAGPAGAQDREKQARSALQAAFAGSDEDAQMAAIEEWGDVEDPGVVKELGKAIRAKHRAVRRASIDALGRMKSKDALKELHQTYRKNQRLRNDDETFSLLLQSIGRHGDPSSVKVLADHPFKNLTAANGTARILGLGNIRSSDAIDELVKASRKAGGARGRGARARNVGQRRFLVPYRTAMVVLTGEDMGQSVADWDRWWQNNKKGYQISRTRPKIPEDVRVDWEAYWGVAYYKDGKAPSTKLERPFEWVAEPTVDEVQEATQELKEAWKSKDPTLKAHALETYGGLDSEEVIHDIARGLRDKDRAVQMTAINVLGWAKSKDALRQLHRMYKRERKWNDKEEVLAELLQAIGRHGDKSSIDVLSDHPFKSLTRATGNARIYGLGNIRDKRSVETLMDMMKLGGGEKRRGRRSGRMPATETRFMDTAEVALAVLTGVNHGQDKEAWLAWWRKEKRKFRMSKERPAIDDRLVRKWESYWGQPY